MEESLVEESVVKEIAFAKEEVVKEIMEYFVVFSSGAINPPIALFLAYVFGLTFDEAIKNNLHRLAKKVVRLDKKLEESDKKFLKFARVFSKPASHFAKLFLGDRSIEEVEKLSFDERRKLFEDIIEKEEKIKEFEEILNKLFFEDGYSLEDFKKEVEERYGVKIEDIAILDFFLQFKDIITTRNIKEILKKVSESDKKIQERITQIEKKIEKLDISKLEKKIKEYNGKITRNLEEIFQKQNLRGMGFKIVKEGLDDFIDKGTDFKYTIEDYKKAWMRMLFGFKDVWMNADAPREVGERIVNHIKNGRNVFITGESFTGKSIVMLRSMINALGFFDVVLYNDGKGGDSGNVNLFEAALENLKDKKVLVVYDDIQKMENQWIIRAVNECKSLYPNVTFLLSALKPEYELIKNPVYSVQKRIELREIMTFDDNVEIVENLDVTEKDFKEMINKCEEIFGRKFDKEELLGNFKEKRISRIAGDVGSLLVFIATGKPPSGIIMDGVSERISKLEENWKISGLLYLFTEQLD